MEEYSSIGFFLPNFAMSEGNKRPRKALFDRLIQTDNTTKMRVCHNVKLLSLYRVILNVVKNLTSC